MHRIRAKLSFANVTSVIALFIALSSAAYAADGLITGKDIKNNSVKGKDIAEHTLKNVTHCPTVAPSAVGDLCFTGPQPAADWATSLKACKDRGLRLPDVGEAMLIGGIAQFTNSWTSDTADISPAVLRTVVASKAEPLVSTKTTSSILPSRCVASPQNGSATG
jgi:hypothetical protein